MNTKRDLYERSTYSPCNPTHLHINTPQHLFICITWTRVCPEWNVSISTHLHTHTNASHTHLYSSLISMQTHRFIYSFASPLTRVCHDSNVSIPTQLPIYMLHTSVSPTHLHAHTHIIWVASHIWTSDDTHMNESCTPDDTHMSFICVCMSFVCVLWWYIHI